MVLSFAFDTSKGETAETLKRKRALADALLRPTRTPTNVAEGLTAIGDALAGRYLDNKLSAQEKAGQEEVGNLFTSAYGGGDTPSTPSIDADTVVSSAPKDGPKTASQAIGGDTSSGSPIEVASTLIGKGEVPDRDTIKEYLANGGVNLDPATTAWCAAFVNATLGQTGGKGTGSNLARSFLNWGDAVDKPQKGDVAVFSRGNPNGPYGHVGFFEGYNPDGSIKVLGGNQGNAVSIASYAPDRLLGFRRAAVAQALAQQGAGNQQAPVQVASLDPSSGMGSVPEQESASEPSFQPTNADFTSDPRFSIAPNVPFESQGGGDYATPQVAAALAQPQQGQAPVQSAPRLPGVSDALLRKNDAALGGILSGDNRQRVGAALGGYFPAAPSADGKPVGKGRPGEIRKGTDGQSYQYAETSGMAGDDGTGQGWIRVNDGGGQGADYFPPAPSNVDTMPTGATNGGTNQIPDLIRVINHPYATDTQKALAAQRLKEIQDQNDPDKQLERRYRQAQLDALTNKPSDKVRTLTQDEVQALGLDPTKAYQQEANGKISQIGGSGVTVNLPGAPEIGTIPQGYEAYTDPETKQRRMRRIPGGPEDDSSKVEAQQDAAKITTDTLTNATKNIGDILASGSYVTGAGGKLASNLSSSNAAELRRQVDVLKSTGTIETLNAMRKQSPTGGALGNVTEGEGKMLAAKAGAIDPDSSAEQFQAQYKDYYRTLLRIVNGSKVGDAIYDEMFPTSGTSNNDPAPEGIDPEMWKYATPEERKLFKK